MPLFALTGLRPLWPDKVRVALLVCGFEIGC